MPRRTYTWAVDAGHEWLMVKLYELKNLGIEECITPFSYAKGGIVYLEGDCDAFCFIDALKFDVKTKRGKFYKHHPCRSFARYVPHGQREKKKTRHGVY